MSGGHKREQSREAESQVNTRQDRNLFLTDGGMWTWDGAILSWTADAKIQVGGLTEFTLSGPDSVGVPAALGRCVYVDLDRDTGGATLSVIGTTISATFNSTDTRLVLATRGADGKLYFRNGTVFSPGDTKPFGTLNAATDRTEIVGDGTVGPHLVGFDYVIGSDQLAVYVGGILQILGTHYTETVDSPGSITFVSGFEPNIGELITFLNVAGGQGPPGLGTLQDAYNAGNEIDVGVGGTPVNVYKTFAPTIPIGDAMVSSADDVWASLTKLAALTSEGFVITQGFGSAAHKGGMVMKDDTAGGFPDYWHEVSLDDGSGDLLLFNNGTGQGLRLAKDGSGIEFGTYTAGFFPYPGGTWSPVGAGPVRWAHYTGSTGVPGGPLPIVTFGGGEVILGVVAFIDDPVSGAWVPPNFATDALLRYAAVVNIAANRVDLSLEPDGTGIIGASLFNRTYHVLVFYRG
jgi:hypothetical protein